MIAQAKSGWSRTKGRKCHCVMPAQRSPSAAVIEAERARPSMIAISPKESPGPSARTSPPPTETFALPSRMTKKPMPPSPSTMTSWPSEYVRSCIDSASLRRSFSGSSENIGTARSESDIALIFGSVSLPGSPPLPRKPADVLGDVLRELLDGEERLRLMRRGVREGHRTLLEPHAVAEDP